ncbi:hypothetical protein [Sphingomonas yabuuchiae]|nr:hypothetical protein [Sphingomonas yabuuchiae]MBN3557925.1 hypothetical protein [Sphingomonas yabuuchiae]
MARTAVEAGNDEEAIAYFNRVLEADPTVSEAWWGKGLAVARLSSLKNIRLRETAVAFGHAIGTAADDEKPGIASQAAAELTKLGSTIFTNAQLHWREFRTTDGAWSTCVNAGLEVIEALQTIQKWQPGYVPAQLEIVTICVTLLNQGVGPKLDAQCRETLDQTVADIQVQDPEYVPPALAAESAAAKEARAVEAKANSDAIGYVVLFIVLIVGGIITAMARAKG